LCGEEANRYFDRIEELGGVVSGIEKGFFQREIQEASFRYQSDIESGRRKVVGVNYMTSEEPPKVPPLRIAESARNLQIRRLRLLKKNRNEKRWQAAMEELKRVAATPEGNTMEPILAALRVGATLGEMVTALEEVFGRYRESSMF
ncbi:MAG: methylmalonyl-CoA mutase family protein, partial [Candidatus Thermoplasmatota archaeon]|nr:methylmalonyl-CoA mutase family protein [Candidatus Thermoplasmatota archaeon]